MNVTDSDALAYLMSNLAHKEAMFWERKYTPIRYQELIPVSFEAGEWATSVEIHYMDAATEGRFIGSSGDDIAFARASTGRDQLPVRYGGIGYEYNLEELRQAAFLQKPLDAMLANAARRGYEEHAQRVAFLGDSTRGLEGLLNHSTVPTAAAASTFALAADGDAIAAIINEPINQILEQSQGAEVPDTVLLPISRLNLLRTTRLDTTVSAMTIGDYVQAHNATGRPLRFIGLPQLTNSMVVYSSSPDVMVMHIPLPLRFLAPQPTNLKVRIPGEYKLSGVEMRFPGAVRYRTGI